MVKKLGKFGKAAVSGALATTLMFGLGATLVGCGGNNADDNKKVDDLAVVQQTILDKLEELSIQVNGLSTAGMKEALQKIEAEVAEVLEELASGDNLTNAQLDEKMDALKTYINNTFISFGEVLGDSWEEYDLDGKLEVLQTKLDEIQTKLENQETQVPVDPTIQKDLQRQVHEIEKTVKVSEEIDGRDLMLKLDDISFEVEIANLNEDATTLLQDQILDTQKSVYVATAYQAIDKLMNTGDYFKLTQEMKDSSHSPSTARGIGIYKFDDKVELVGITSHNDLNQYAYFDGLKTTIATKNQGIQESEDGGYDNKNDFANDMKSNISYVANIAISFDYNVKQGFIANVEGEAGEERNLMFTIDKEGKFNSLSQTDEPGFSSTMMIETSSQEEFDKNKAIVLQEIENARNLQQGSEQE